jgi:YD repeat-containing protein
VTSPGGTITIAQQAETVYDPAGNVIQTTLRQRLHTEVDSHTGSLQDLGVTPEARVSYTAAWYDGVGRPIASANYGTNGNEPLTPPVNVPAASDTILVTATAYKQRGEAYQTTDPAGKIAFQTFDDAGRVISTIQNFVTGTAVAATPDQDVTVLTTYTRDGQVATLTAVNPATNNQVTQYVYGTSPATSAIARSDLLVAEIYPHSADSADQVSYTYNRQGQVLTKADQNGTVHTYSYDGLGRPLADAVTALGAGVDGAVRSIARSYYVQGQVYEITSYNSATQTAASNIVNQVSFVYNPFGQLITENQEHGGEVGTSTPSVGYSYADGSSGTIRPTALSYPDGRVLSYDYTSGSDSGLDHARNRVRYLDDGLGGPALAEYSYLGAGTIVRVTYPEPCLRGGVYQGRGSDPYTGLDAFGRVIDLAWLDCTTGQAVVRIGHGYDRAGYRLWRVDSVARAAGKHFDELYGYDGVNQLVSFDRGRLNTPRTALGTVGRNFAQQWTLDATGNWTRFIPARSANSA